MTFDRQLWEDINESLKVTFEAAAKERPNRQEFVTDPVTGYTEPAFALFERKALWVAVNLWRANSHLPPITEKDIARVEQMAVGHVDYSSKFVLYCTELALGQDNIRP